jgi:hypothetical protein
MRHDAPWRNLSHGWGGSPGVGLTEGGGSGRLPALSAARKLDAAARAAQDRSPWRRRRQSGRRRRSSAIGRGRWRRRASLAFRWFAQPDPQRCPAAGERGRRRAGHRKAGHIRRALVAARPGAEVEDGEVHSTALDPRRKPQLRRARDGQRADRALRDAEEERWAGRGATRGRRHGGMARRATSRRQRVTAS